MVFTTMRTLTFPKWYVAIIPLFALAFLLVSCNSNSGSTASNSASSSLQTQQTTSADSSMQAASPKDSALAQARASLSSMNAEHLTGKHTVILHTSKGDITLELDANAAPKTVTNFVLLAKAGYYDNLTFHRVINNFMIQGGDPSGNGTGGESVFGPTFEDEINADSYGLQNIKVKDVAQGQQIPPGMENLSLKDVYTQQGMHFNSSLKSIPMARGIIAMANRGPDTNGSQFFILQSDAPAKDLSGKYTVFGKVTSGMDVVDAIAGVETEAMKNKKENPNCDGMGQGGCGEDKPVVPVTFTVEVKS